MGQVLRRALKVESSVVIREDVSNLFDIVGHSNEINEFSIDEKRFLIVFIEKNLLSFD